MISHTTGYVKPGRVLKSSGVIQAEQNVTKHFEPLNHKSSLISDKPSLERVA